MNNFDGVFIFLVHYFSFALFFYIILKCGPMKLTIKDIRDDTEVENTLLEDLFLLLICIAWIIEVPLILFNSFKKIK